MMGFPRCPFTPGGDVAGTVLEADEGSAFKKGQHVSCAVLMVAPGAASMAHGA